MADSGPEAHCARSATEADSYIDSTAAGLSVSLSYYGEHDITFLGFGPAEEPSAAKPAPTLEEEGGILDRLLGCLIAEHSSLMAREIKFAPDQTPLVQALDQRLLDPRSGWDVKRGAPRQGNWVDLLKTELNEVIGNSPIQAAFEKHGYKLSLVGISRVTMPPIHAKIRVPDYIYDINIRATRMENGNGAP